VSRVAVWVWRSAASDWWVARVRAALARVAFDRVLPRAADVLRREDALLEAGLRAVLARAFGLLGELVGGVAM
jgi:hypothetical protein